MEYLECQVLKVIKDTQDTLVGDIRIHHMTIHTSIQKIKDLWVTIRMRT